MELKSKIPKSKKDKNKLCIKESKYNQFKKSFNDFMWCRVYDKNNTKVIGALYFGKIINTKTIFMTCTRVHKEDSFDPRIGMKIAINRLTGTSDANIWIAKSADTSVETDQVLKIFPNCNKERLIKNFNGCINKMSKN